MSVLIKSDENDIAYKFFISDLKNIYKNSKGEWTFKFNEKCSVPVFRLHIQGTISKTAGFENEILIIEDNTGKAKVTRTKSVPGNFSWLSQGSYCSVVGILVDTGKLPHVNTIKLVNLSENKILKQMWPLEVKELKNLLNNEIIPDISSAVGREDSNSSKDFDW